MADVDRIIEQLLGDRRIRESATFTSRTFADQPLIERGRDLQERMKRREAERAERHQQAAEKRTRQRARQRASERGSERKPQPKAEPSAPRSARSMEEAVRHAATPPSGFFAIGSKYVNNLSGLVDEAARTLTEVTLPPAIREMRQLERGGAPLSLTYGSAASASLFYRQACLMEHYEDDYEFNGTFSQYYPTYAAMSNQQLRGYFAWRTRIRAGRVDDAPLSFAFVYVYELLCGIGTIPGEQGLADLRAFDVAYREASPFNGGRLHNYLHTWMRDYAVYHGIMSEFSSQQETVATHVITLLTAEHTQLAAEGLKPRIANASVGSTPPTRDQLFRALGEAASYHLGQSRLAKDEPELLVQVAADVFAALVSHCAKRRKTDFVEGLFGYASNMPYTMFSAAVFYDPVPHPNCEVVVSPTVKYICTDGRWRELLACEAKERSSELGLLMHEVDFELRRQLDYAYPLKQRKVPKYVEHMVQKAVAARLKERAEAAEAKRRAEEEAERRRITIDRSKLRGIRAAAALTQEALLTDEERGEDMSASGAPRVRVADALEHLSQNEGTPVTPQQPAHQVDVSASGGTTPTAGSSDSGLHQPRATEPAATVTTTTPTADATSSSDACEAATTYGLTPLELRVLRGLMAGAPVAELLGPTDPFVSVVVDTINEKLFDLVGDAVVEFDGDEPHIIEEYLDDVREVV